MLLGRSIRDKFEDRQEVLFSIQQPRSLSWWPLSFRLGKCQRTYGPKASLSYPGTRSLQIVCRSQYVAPERTLVLADSLSFSVLHSVGASRQLRSSGRSCCCCSAGNFECNGPLVILVPFHINLWNWNGIYWQCGRSKHVWIGTIWCSYSLASSQDSLRFEFHIYVDSFFFKGLGMFLIVVTEIVCSFDFFRNSVEAWLVNWMAKSLGLGFSWLWSCQNISFKYHCSVTSAWNWA